MKYLEKARHCEGVRRPKQSPGSAMVLEIAALTVKNSYFSLFPRNDERVEFCGDPSGTVILGPTPSEMNGTL